MDSGLDAPSAKADAHAGVIGEAAEWVTRTFGLAPGTVEHWRMVELILAIRAAPAREANELMAAALDERGVGTPPLDAWGDLRADAAFWADCATPAEIECVAAAALRRIDRALFGAATRKRIFVALWDAMAPADRKAFLRRVDPAGKFRRAA